jgi:predicted CoA-binding protein
MRVAILGASDKPERFAFKAARLLTEHGHEIVEVSPRSRITSLKDVGGSVDTLTMYVGPALSEKLSAEILALKPRRVVFNPGSENPALEANLKAAGIEVVEDCTLMMLRGERF